MNKDVIYIDVDDDVTAIIGKLKSAKEKIVALVPPKRAGALQSAVNLRLLQRMAKTEEKKLVLITNNQALVALAASAKIPVARNLQSKPELPDVPALVVDDGDDIIDGANLPVGDHAGASVPVHDGTRGQMRSDAIDTIDVDRDSAAAPLAMAAAGKKAKGKTKIPNFDTFRKKLVVGISAGVALIALLVWMFVFAPAATVIITARTTPAPVSTSVTVTTTGSTDQAKSVLRGTMQQQKVDESIEFTATGTDKVGEKAAGTMTITRTSVSNSAISVPAGTRFTSGSVSFVSTQAATLDGTTVGSSGIIQDSATITVQATAVGAEYNVSARNYQASVGGFSSAGSTMSGGSSREVKVVSPADVERAYGDLIGKSTDEAKSALTKKFDSSQKAIDGSFTVERGTQVSSPNVGEEAANGKAKLTIPTTYSMYAIAQSELEAYLKQTLEKQLLNGSQKVYDGGHENAALSDFRKEGDVATATLIATGQVGPKIDEGAIKDQVKGKRFGEVQSTIQSIEGVQEVDVKFSYPWVWSVPGNADKIDIEFKLQNES